MQICADPLSACVDCIPDDLGVAIEGGKVQRRVSERVCGMKVDLEFNQFLYLFCIASVTCHQRRGARVRDRVRFPPGPELCLLARASQPQNRVHAWERTWRQQRVGPQGGFHSCGGGGVCVARAVGTVYTQHVRDRIRQGPES